MSTLKEKGTGRTTNIILQCVRDAMDYADSPIHCFDHDTSSEGNHVYVACAAEKILQVLTVPVTREGNVITVPKISKE